MNIETVKSPRDARDLVLEGTALFLDLDGTLAQIAERPGAVMPQTVRTSLLMQLRNRLGGRLAIVSGRPIRDVDRIVDETIPAVAGIHGLERRSAAGELTRPVPKISPELRAALRALADETRGLLLEDKGLSIAIHFRDCPQAADHVRAVAQELARDGALLVQEGAMVIELRPHGPDKGDAIAAFMGEEPFAGARPIFAGDDLTDEHGFAAVAALGGYGVLVGPARATLARERLNSVDDVFFWLARALEKRT